MGNPNALPVNTRIGGYVIMNELGSGGFGITYRARDLMLDRDVVIKEYFPATFAQRLKDHTVVSRADGSQEGYEWGRGKFHQEAQILARHKHQNLVEVIRLLPNYNGTSYMVLDFIDGDNLKVWLKTLRRRPTQEELDGMLYPLLDALERVHAAGHLHRDIAPKNIMVNKQAIPILIDFGAARQIIAERSQTLAALLTPGYAPTEQYGASVRDQGPWTDIYALAATFYEAISGRLPPEGPERTLEDRCVPAVEIGSGRYRQSFLEAVDWGLKPLPKQRPQSVSEWRRMMQHAQQPRGGQTEVMPVVVVSKKNSWFSR